MDELDSIRRRGLVIESAVDANRLLGLIRNKLKPIQTQHELMRVGGDQDGGYLIPDDVEGISACFSPGVEHTSTFELDLLDSFGINSHLADFSVDGPPGYLIPLSFTKKFLGPINNNAFMTMDTWVKNTPEFESGEDFLLQMDIEFGEYSTILATSDEVLQRFRIIVMEIHDIDKWGHPAFFQIVESFFDKLLQYFNVVHIHPNNYGVVRNVNGVDLPETLEFTFLAKNRCNVLGNITSFPDELDKPCCPGKDELVLPDIWYK
jgi:hypothetical protein